MTDPQEELRKFSLDELPQVGQVVRLTWLKRNNFEGEVLETRVTSRAHSHPQPHFSVLLPSRFFAQRDFITRETDFFPENTEGVYGYKQEYSKDPPIRDLELGTAEMMGISPNKAYWHVLVKVILPSPKKRRA